MQPIFSLCLLETGSSCHLVAQCEFSQETNCLQRKGWGTNTMCAWHLVNYGWKASACRWKAVRAPYLIIFYTVCAHIEFPLLIYLGLDRQGRTRSKTSIQSVSWNTLYGRSVFNMQLLHKSMEVIKKEHGGLIFLLYMFKSDTDDERFKLKSI